MLTTSSISGLKYLACSQCGRKYAADQVQTYATCCNKPLDSIYNLDIGFTKQDLSFRPSTLWRYAEVLPVSDPENIVSLGEGMTPIVTLSELGKSYGFSQLFMKDESYNPTGSFKARGMSVAISKAKELGITDCIVPTAGNAGGAMSAYCARAGINATVVMPVHTPKIFKEECELYGAELILVDGLINDCAKKVEELKKLNTYFDLSTLKEPYRLEGKKTMGYEIAEQFSWELPDVIIYPTGGGTGLIGIWKAIHEMIQMGWIPEKLPRMIAVQAGNCQPIVLSMKGLLSEPSSYHAQPSIANGLAVPYPFGRDLIIKTIRESNGYALSVSEEEILRSLHEVVQTEGIMLCPEGAATWAGLLDLLQKGKVSRDEKILLLNTGSGYKYFENLDWD